MNAVAVDYLTHGSRTPDKAVLAAAPAINA